MGLFSTANDKSANAIQFHKIFVSRFSFTDDIKNGKSLIAGFSPSRMMLLYRQI